MGPIYLTRVFALIQVADQLPAGYLGCKKLYALFVSLFSVEKVYFGKKLTQKHAQLPSRHNVKMEWFYFLTDLRLHCSDTSFYTDP